MSRRENLDIYVARKYFTPNFRCLFIHISSQVYLILLQ